MVGSSWNAADSSGEAPMMSPAATVMLCSSLAAARSCASCVDRYSTPPAGWPAMVPLDPLGGSRLPWKSLRASSLTSTGGGHAGPALLGVAATTAPSALVARAARPMAAFRAPGIDMELLVGIGLDVPGTDDRSAARMSRHGDSVDCGER